MTKHWNLVAAASLIALALGLSAVQPARANGVPLLVDLTYLSGLSNWGPTTASGTLELALGEGYAKVTAAGMTRANGQRYQGWLVNSQSNDAISIGTFNAAADGSVSYRSNLPATVNFGFDLFIITVEPDPDDAPQPTSQRSIGGRFSLIGQRAADGMLSSEAQMTGGGPRQLPNTGDNTLQSDLLRVGVLLSALGAALLTGMRLGREDRMIRALYTSASAMLFGMRQQEMAAGNLANSGTSGYKAETSAASAFSGVLARRVGSAAAPVPVQVGEVLGTIGTGVYQSVRGNDFSDGALRNTGLTLDAALTGPGFFVVETKDGLAYTRDGHFMRNSENTLVTAEGDPVLSTDGSAITLTSDRVRITPAGELMVEDQPVGSLQIVGFDVKRAVRAGSTHFIPGEGDQTEQIEAGEGTLVKQGQLEESNVNAAGSAASVISVGRAFEANRNIFTSINETLSQSVNDVGRVAR